LENSGFKKITESEKRLYGKYGLLVSGFSKNEQDALIAIVEKFNSLKVIFVQDEHMDTLLKDMFDKDDRCGYGNDSSLKRVIIFSGFKEKDLVNFMERVKALSLRKNLWAALTPISEKWTIRRLIKELELEDKEMPKK